LQHVDTNRELFPCETKTNGAMLTGSAVADPASKVREGAIFSKMWQ